MSEFLIQNGILIAYNGTDEVVTVPSGVVEIGESCFRGKSFVKEIYLPEWELGENAEETERNLKVIRPFAFAGTGITSIVIPKYAFVQSFAFQGCRMDSITGGATYDLQSLEGCTVSDIFLYANTYLVYWNNKAYGFEHTGLENCTLHSKTTPNALNFDYCYACGHRYNVKWVYDTDVLNALVAEQEKYRALYRKKSAELEVFRKKNHLKFKSIFHKKSAETLRLQEEEKRLMDESDQYFKLWYFELAENIKKEQEQIKRYTENYETVRKCGNGTSYIFAGLHDTKPAPPSGAFVPRPDIKDI